MTDGARTGPLDGDRAPGPDRRRAPRRAVLAVVAALVAIGLGVALAVALTGRGGDGPAAVAPDPEASTTADPTPSASPSATASPTPTATDAPAPEVTADPTAAPTPEPTAAPAEPAPADPAPTDPAPTPQRVTPRHGDELWGVYLATMESYATGPDPAVDERLRSLGLDPAGRGEVACDEGAPEALGLDPRTIASSVYFATEAEARQFVELYGRDVVGVAPVITLCLD